MLLYSTYLGGGDFDSGYALAPDGSGGVWVAGSTSSDDFLVTSDAYQGSHGGGGDVFLSRFFSSGMLLYSTYLRGSGTDRGTVLAPDGSGGVWVAGETYSTDFPVTSDAFQGMPLVNWYSDAFASRFSAGIQPPITNFTAAFTTGEALLTVQFTDTSTNIPTSWLWEYGTGDTWTLFSTLEQSVLSVYLR